MCLVSEGFIPPEEACEIIEAVLSVLSTVEGEAVSGRRVGLGSPAGSGSLPPFLCSHVLQEVVTCPCDAGRKAGKR